MDNDRRRKLEAAIGQIEKDHGKGAILRMGEHDAGLSLEVIPTAPFRLTSRSASAASRAGG